MSTATIHPLPSRRTEAFTVTDVTDMLTLAADYLSAHRVECSGCRRTATGTCRAHDEDDRLSFLAARLSDGLKNAGPHVIAELLALGRDFSADVTDVAAVSGRSGGKSWPQ